MDRLWEITAFHSAFDSDYKQITFPMSLDNMTWEPDLSDHNSTLRELDTV